MDIYVPVNDKEMPVWGLAIPEETTKSRQRLEEKSAGCWSNLYALSGQQPPNVPLAPLLPIVRDTKVQLPPSVSSKQSTRRIVHMNTCNDRLV
jgi:hypothetical protein